MGALCVAGKKFTRSELDGWVNEAQELGSKGLLYVRFGQDGTIESPVAKFLPADFFEKARSVFKNLTHDDTLFFVAGPYKNAWEILGRLRLALAKELNLIQPHILNLCWVVDFPMNYEL